MRNNSIVQNNENYENHIENIMSSNASEFFTSEHFYIILCLCLFVVFLLIIMTFIFGKQYFELYSLKKSINRRKQEALKSARQRRDALKDHSIPSSHSEKPVVFQNRLEVPPVSEDRPIPSAPAVTQDSVPFTPLGSSPNLPQPSYYNAINNSNQ